MAEKIKNTLLWKIVRHCNDLIIREKNATDKDWAVALS